MPFVEPCFIGGDMLKVDGGFSRIQASRGDGISIRKRTRIVEGRGVISAVYTE